MKGCVWEGDEEVKQPNSPLLCVNFSLEVGKEFLLEILLWCPRIQTISVQPAMQKQKQKQKQNKCRENLEEGRKGEEDERERCAKIKEQTKQNNKRKERKQIKHKFAANGLAELGAPPGKWTVS